MHHIFFPVFTLTSVNWGVPRQRLPRRCHRIRQGLLGVRIGPEFPRASWLELPKPHRGRLQESAGPACAPHDDWKLGARRPARVEERRAPGQARRTVAISGGRSGAWQGACPWIGAGSVARGARRDVRTGGAVTSGRAMVRCEASAWRHDAVAQWQP